MMSEDVIVAVQQLLGAGYIDKSTARKVLSNIMELPDE